MTTPTKSPAAKKSRADDGALSEDKVPELPSIKSDKESRPSWTMDFQAEIISGVKAAVKDEMHAMRQQMDKLDTKAEEALTVAREARDVAGAAKVQLEEAKSQFISAEVPNELSKRISCLEDKISEMKSCPSLVQPCVLVLGGLDMPNVTAGKDWVLSSLRESGGPSPIETYMKGPPDGTFKGLLFAKFDTSEGAAAALDIMRGKCASENARRGDDTMGCNYQRPADERARRNILFGTRYLLVTKFKLPKRYLKVAEESSTLMAGGEEILTVSTEKDKIKIQWRNVEWEKWTELTQSEEFMKLVGDASSKVRDSFTSQSKGDGKGHQ